MNILFIIACLASVASSLPVPDTVGFQIGQVKEYKLLNKSGASALYEIDSPQIQDGRPMKLLHLVGSHYEAGYAYGALMGQQILQTYQTFMTFELKNRLQLRIMELFLNWQYDNFVVKSIPSQFLEELAGIQKSGEKLHNTSKLRNIFERILVVSSYPGDISSNMMYAMIDVFLQEGLRIKNPRLLDYVEDNLFALVKKFKHFMNKMRIHCSFMAIWGSRTQGGKLYTMRNLDWAANTGINKNKMIFVWSINNTIPHTTFGFPGIMGALTGMSQAGITVHEAGLDSMKESELGFQWTLRLRYILMHAKNLEQAKTIWLTTENTFGMNHMIASAADVATGEAPVFVAETMRGYSAFFKDKDPRQDNTSFIDPKTKKPYRAGYAMKDAVFRTNHAYDPKINKFKTSLPTEGDDSIHRYFIIKDTINGYQLGQIGDLEVLNITANVADKAGGNFYKCPKPRQDSGINIISAVFVPGEQRMYIAMEYGQGNTYRPACCGVYLKIDMVPWFKKAVSQPSEESLTTQ